jgi:hypothetical protein
MKFYMFFFFFCYMHSTCPVRLISLIYSVWKCQDKNKNMNNICIWTMPSFGMWCLYMYVSICVCMYMYVCIYMHVCMYSCLCICVCTCVSMHVCHASSWTVGRILFLFGFQQFIRSRICRVHGNFPGPKISALGMCFKTQKTFSNTTHTILITFQRFMATAL